VIEEAWPLAGADARSSGNSTANVSDASSIMR
jgi:hypothetical protein